MYLEGRTQTEISELIGVSRQQIGYDIQTLITRWKESQLENIDKKKIIEIEKLNKVENEAWLAWEKSIGKIEKSVLKSGTNNKGDFLEESVTVYESPGNPKFLSVILNCSSQRCRILGLDVQEKQGDTDEGLISELISMLKEPDGSDNT
jgi:hypothetical protein